MNRIQTSAVVLWLGLAVSAMAAEPVQERFQKALFEEEANQNITNAITGYESVLDAADAPIRFAATALYRLGECHRKLGRTNEATVAFERLAREFVGQTNLVRLARQNLVALGWREPSLAPERASGAGPAAANPAVQKAQADLAEAARIERVIEMSKSGDGSSTRDILEAGFTSSELDLIKKELFDIKSLFRDAQFRFRDAPDKDKKGNQAGFELEGRGECGSEPGFKRRDAGIGIDAGGCAVGDRDQADAQGA